MSITESLAFEPGVYFVPDGIRIENDGVTVDGAGATLIGSDRKGVAVTISGQSNVNLKNLRISEFYHGIHARDCANLKITCCRITSTAEIAPNTIFLDIWLGPEKAYGGAILLWNCEDTTLENNDLQHQQSGLLTYGCRNLRVLGNQ